MAKLLTRVLLPMLLAVLLISLPNFAAEPSKTQVKKTPKISPKVNPDQEIRMRDHMIEISRHLGVTCNYCHDVQNFRKNDMKTWKKAKEHLKVVDLLNNRGFINGPKADCYMCHRGQAVPDYKEPAAVNKTEGH